MPLLAGHGRKDCFGVSEYLVMLDIGIRSEEIVDSENNFPEDYGIGGFMGIMGEFINIGQFDGIIAGAWKNVNVDASMNT